MTEIQVQTMKPTTAPSVLTAPLSVRIDYRKEVRQARISCRLDAKGRVIRVT